MASEQHEEATAIMDIHAHTKPTHSLRLTPARHLSDARDDIHGDCELPIWPVGVFAWVVVPVAFWGGVIMWAFKR